MIDLPSRDPQLQVKSAERVRDLGEVFTPPGTVEAMLDLLPSEMWQPHPSPTFLEPACGDGNFLVAILDRKLKRIAEQYQEGALPAGNSPHSAQFHALEALASIYGVDISIENVIGGTPGHEVGARHRMLAHLRRWHAATAGRLTDASPFHVAAGWIVERNILIGNMLAAGADSTPSCRDDPPLVEYVWDPTTLSVTLYTTTLGAVIDTSQAETAEVMSLFGAPEPRLAWTGRALGISIAPIEAPAALTTHLRNRNGVL